MWVEETHPDLAFAWMCQASLSAAFTSHNTTEALHLTSPSGPHLFLPFAMSRVDELRYYTIFLA